MDKIEVKNKSILHILNDIKDNILSEDTKTLYDIAYDERLGRDGKEYNDGMDITSGTSYDYHQWLMNGNNHEGFPECSLLIDYRTSVGAHKLNNRDKVMSLANNMTSELGASNNSLLTYYPVDGYIGWHHNANARGYNVLFTYSDCGGGYFEEYDLNAKKYIMHKDSIGWNVKTGYFGGHDEGNKKVWHCAANKSGSRITISYIINQYDMWMDMKDELGSI
tara:strand:- start:2760 stop:3422 length:663 start_codon:yes stop_codon:yes gene_type:complete